MHATCPERRSQAIHNSRQLDSLDSAVKSTASTASTVASTVSTVIECSVAVKTVKLSSSTARQSRHSLDSSCQARQPRHTQPYMYIPKCSRNLVSCRAWTKSQEGMSSIVGIWYNTAIRESYEPRKMSANVQSGMYMCVTHSHLTLTRKLNDS